VSRSRIRRSSPPRSFASLHHRPVSADKAIDLIDERRRVSRWEIDSKPESMDKLDRRIIQLKIEREAVKKEKDEPRAAARVIETEIRKRKRNTRTWTRSCAPQKAAVQGARLSRARSIASQAQMADLQPTGQFDTCRNPYGNLRSWNRN